jgi:hypothetical protein
VAAHRDDRHALCLEVAAQSPREGLDAAPSLGPSTSTTERIFASAMPQAYGAEDRRFAVRGRLLTKLVYGRPTHRNGAASRLRRERLRFSLRNRLRRQRSNKTDDSTGRRAIGDALPTTKCSPDAKEYEDHPWPIRSFNQPASDDLASGSSLDEGR